MKNILVLGGSGFVGAHVCEKLVREGWNVTVPTRRWFNAKNVLPLPTVTVLEVDIHDEAALTRVMAGHDAVVNLVAILHGNQAAFEKVHVALPEKIARACVANGVRQLVHVSALGAQAQHPESAPSKYLRSKGQGEAALLRAAATGAFDLRILRPSVIFGARDKFLNLFASLQAVFPFMPLAAAHARFQPVWVEDVAAAVVRNVVRGPVTGAAPQTYELCGPDVYTLGQLVRISAQLHGINAGLGRPVLALPTWLGRLQALLMELAPGAPLMSRDNLDSMRVDNVASKTLPGLEALGITAGALEPIARDYLAHQKPTYGLLGLRQSHPAA